MQLRDLAKRIRAPKNSTEAAQERIQAEADTVDDITGPDHPGLADYAEAGRRAARAALPDTDLGNLEED